MKLFTLLMLAAATTVAVPAQTVYVPVNAPYAQSLVIATKNAHPELQKLGLHAIPPGEQDYAIIANPIPSKIGKESSGSDLSVISRSRRPKKKESSTTSAFPSPTPRTTFSDSW